MRLLKQHRIALVLVVSLLVQVLTVSAQSSTERPTVVTPPMGMLVTSGDSMELLRSGRLALIDFRFKEAEGHFTRLANRSDGRAAGMYHLALVSFVRYVMSDRETDMEEFILRSDELRRTLASGEDTPWRHLLGAETNLQRAVVWAKQGKYVRAALSGRTAYRTYHGLVSKDPTFLDAQKGYGLLKVAIASLPGTYRRFLALAGFSGNTQVGYGALRASAEGSQFMREEASIYLSLFDVILEGSSMDGEERLKRLHERFPRSPLFAHLYGYYLFENRRATEAEKVFRVATATRGDGSVFYLDYVDHFLGLTLFRQNRFEEAIPFFERYRTDHSGEALMAPTLLHLGLSHEMAGNRAAAVEIYLLVDAKREFDTDAVSARRAQRLVARPMDDFERLLLRGANAYDAGNYDEAARLLASVAQTEGAPPSVLAETAYRLGRLGHARGELQDALEHYREAVEIRGGELDRWAPWSEYYSGKVFEELGEPAEARGAYERALAYRGRFDYHQALENSARNALKRLK